MNDYYKNAFYANKLNCIGDPSQQWKIINKLTSSRADKIMDKLVLDNGAIVVEPGAIAEETNK